MQAAWWRQGAVWHFPCSVTRHKTEEERLERFHPWRAAEPGHAMGRRLASQRVTMVSSPKRISREGVAKTGIV